MTTQEQNAYIQTTWGVSGDGAQAIRNKAEYILSLAPDGDWYTHTVKRAGEENRDIETQALHEANYILNRVAQNGDGGVTTNGTTQTAGFMGLPNLVWYVVGAGVLYYGYTKGWFGKFGKKR